ncbi:DUF4317 family protein [Clostridium oryzae]|uniref:DUF4317 family protein n=1 Tax=Clostridium oryzae TaxID=1450648 RepID=A0A1V4IDV0_9CLOT|nr:DUF4317 family protein [Clostridium oryzae]OPJ58178.1 hypothetical protein CLORY_37420 [Clostridium oryzae]
MNKQDLAGIRRELKADNTMLQISDIYSVYLKKDNQEIIHSQFEYFDSMDSEKQELYLKNFKKILSGALDTKLFELDFVNIDDEDNTQNILYSAVNNDRDTFREETDKIVNKIAENYKYETDVVITFIKAEYWKGASKRRNEEAEEAKDDSVFAFQFMMCSINKIEPPKKTLKFDYIEREFKASTALDFTINLNSPLDGFMFPAFNNNSADANKVMYYTDKPKEINENFVKGLLDCGLKKTAQQEKEEFVGVLKTVVGEKIAPETMQCIYEKLSEKLNDTEEESEVPVVSAADVKEVLEESGIEDVDGVEEAYNEVIGDINYEFKVQNIVPVMDTKSIKISTEDISLSIAPKELKNIRKVKDSNGNTCLLIELNDEVVIDGFEIPIGEI